jgi:hexulose-6-phosphate isomerase
MKISASYWMFAGWLEGKKPVAEALAEAKRAGFDAIELAIASSGVLTPETTRAECATIVRQAHELGVEIASLASGESWSCSPTATDPQVRRRIIAFTKKAHQIANWLQTDAYLFVPGAVDIFFMPNAEVIPYEVCYRRAAAAVRQLRPVAERLGVTLCIENVWNKFLLSPLEMRDFIDSFKSRRVQAYFDVGNILLTGFPDQWLRILGRRVKRVHVKDFKTAVGTAAGFCDLLEGSVDFPAVRKALAAIRYDGYVTAEVIPFAPGRLEKTAAAMKKIFR